MIGEDRRKYDVVVSEDNHNIRHNPVIWESRAKFLYDCYTKIYNKNLVAILKISEKRYFELRNK